MYYGALIHGIVTFGFGCLAVYSFGTRFGLYGLISLWWVAGFWGGREAGQHDDFPFTLHQILEWAPSQLIALVFTAVILKKIFTYDV